MGTSNSVSSLSDNIIPGSRAITIKSDNIIIKNAIIGLSLLDDSEIKKIIIGKYYVHASLFLGNDLTNFQKNGIILEYGNYTYEKKKEIEYEYKDEGGLRYAYMSYNNFNEKYSDAAMITLSFDSSFPEMNFNDLIKELGKTENGGKWTKKNYDWKNHNCQHFVAQAIKILKPKFDVLGIHVGKNYDVINNTKEDVIPNVILKELKKRPLRTNK